MHGSCALLLAELNVSGFEISATFHPNWCYLSVNKRYISPIKRFKIRNKRFKIRTIASRINRLANPSRFERCRPARLGRRDRGGVANHPDRGLFPVAKQAPSTMRPALLRPLRRLDQVRPRTRPGRPAGKPPIDAIRDSSDLLATLPGYLRLPAGGPGQLVRRMVRDSLGDLKDSSDGIFRGLSRSFKTRRNAACRKSCNGYSMKCNAYSVISRLEIPGEK
jgi:hypothetical protein